MTYRPTPRTADRLARVAIAAVLSTALGLASLAGPAGAQTSTPPGSTVPLTADPSAFNAGGLVFFFVVAVVVAGAALLYLRNRGTSRP
jgi:hypothetical protein